MNLFRFLPVFAFVSLTSLLVVFLLTGCGGGGGGSSPAATPSPSPPPSSDTELFSLDRDTATLYRIDRESGASLGSVAITLAGEILEGGRGLAASPETGQLFGVFQFQTDTGGRRLIATIDPVSGVATQISTQAGRAGALAFDNAGTLYLSLIHI